MKRFKGIKTIKNFEDAKLTREQMYLATGGRRPRGENETFPTWSVCHIDGTDDGDFSY